MGFSIKLQGFEELLTRLDNIKGALNELNGHVASVQFDANNEESINAAIGSVDKEIDQRLSPFSSDPTVQAIAAEFKAKAAANIRQRAKTARSNSGSVDASPKT
jgi:hypothetical protein